MGHITDVSEEFAATFFKVIMIKKLVPVFLLFGTLEYPEVSIIFLLIDSQRY
jgi:hypothetical protein